MGSVVVIAAGIGGATRVSQARSMDAEIAAGAVRDATATERAAPSRLPVERRIAAPVPVAPRLAEELSGAPSLSWRLADGTDGARVELSPNPDFDDESTVRYDVSGSELALPEAPGVWYWRVQGRSGLDIGDATSPTWFFWVPLRSADAATRTPAAVGTGGAATDPSGLVCADTWTLGQSFPHCTTTSSPKRAASSEIYMIFSDGS